MSFLAQYRGVCGECDSPIEVGEEVEYWIGEAVKVLKHVRCPEAIDTTPLGPQCPRCLLYHAGECF